MYSNWSKRYIFRFLIFHVSPGSHWCVVGNPAIQCRFPHRTLTSTNRWGCQCKCNYTPKSGRRSQCEMLNGAGIRSHRCGHPRDPIPVQTKKNPAPFWCECYAISAIQFVWLNLHHIDIACDLHCNAVRITCDV